MHRVLDEGPVVTDPKYFHWVSNNSRLFSWFLDSMKPNNAKYFRYEKT